jgi:hypothetical protein
MSPNDLVEYAIHKALQWEKNMYLEETVENATRKFIFPLSNPSDEFGLNADEDSEPESKSKIGRKRKNPFSESTLLSTITKGLPTTDRNKKKPSISKQIARSKTTGQQKTRKQRNANSKLSQLSRKSGGCGGPALSHYVKVLRRVRRAKKILVSSRSACPESSESDDISEEDIGFSLYPDLESCKQERKSRSKIRFNKLTLEQWKRRRAAVIKRAEQYFYPVDDIMKAEGLKQPYVIATCERATQTNFAELRSVKEAKVQTDPETLQRKRRPAAAVQTELAGIRIQIGEIRLPSTKSKTMSSKSTANKKDGENAEKPKNASSNKSKTGKARTVSQGTTTVSPAVKRKKLTPKKPAKPVVVPKLKPFTRIQQPMYQKDPIRWKEYVHGKSDLSRMKLVAKRMRNVACDLVTPRKLKNFTAAMLKRNITPMLTSMGQQHKTPEDFDTSVAPMDQGSKPATTENDSSSNSKLEINPVPDIMLPVESIPVVLDKSSTRPTEIVLPAEQESESDHLTQSSESTPTQSKSPKTLKPLTSADDELAVASQSSPKVPSSSTIMEPDDNRLPKSVLDTLKDNEVSQRVEAELSATTSLQPIMPQVESFSEPLLTVKVHHVYDVHTAVGIKERTVSESESEALNDIEPLAMVIEVNPHEMSENMDMETNDPGKEYMDLSRTYDDDNL